jgi:hypothetical protein
MPKLSEIRKSSTESSSMMLDVNCCTSRLNAAC